MRPSSTPLVFWEPTLLIVWLCAAWIELPMCLGWSNSSISHVHRRLWGWQRCQQAAGNISLETQKQAARGTRVINDDRWSLVEWQNRETNSVWNAHLSAAVARVSEEEWSRRWTLWRWTRRCGPLWRSMTRWWGGKGRGQSRRRRTWMLLWRRGGTRGMKRRCKTL